MFIKTFSRSIVPCRLAGNEGATDMSREILLTWCLREERVERMERRMKRMKRSSRVTVTNWASWTG